MRYLERKGTARAYCPIPRLSGGDESSTPASQPGFRRTSSVDPALGILSCEAERVAQSRFSAGECQ